MKLYENTPLRHLKNIFLQKHIYEAIESEDVVSKQRFTLFRIFSLTGATVCIGIFIKMLFLFNQLSWLHYLLPALSTVMVFNFYRIKRTDQLSRAYLIVILASFILLHIVSYSTGGIRSASILYFPVIILYSFMLMGKKTGLNLTMLFGVHVIAIFFISRFTNLTSFDFLQNDNRNIEEDFLFNALFTFFLIASQSMYMNSGRNIVFKTIKQQRDELSSKNLLLEQSILSLEKSNQELDKFAYVTSHDLKAPLRAIGNLSGLIEFDLEEDKMEDVKVNLKTIQGRVKRMEALINGILEYSKSTKHNDQEVIVDMKSVLNESIDMLNANNFCTIRINNSLPQLQTSKFKLQQVFLNLINNSIRHFDKDDLLINIDVSFNKGKIYFIFKDNGPGIQPEFHERVFIIFQTLKARDEFENIGVGLAIVKRIIDDLGGEIWIDSNYKMGASFHFTIPCPNFEKSDPRVLLRKVKYTSLNAESF